MNKTFADRHPVFLVCLILVACIGLVEAAAWIWLNRADSQNNAATAPHEVFDHFMSFRPNTIEGGFRVRDGHPCVPGTFSEFVIDENGFHNPSPGLTVQPRHDELRVALFGASQLYGIGAQKTEQTIAAHVERMLQQRIPERKIRVINAAVRGYLGVQEMLYYWSRVHQFSPDIVISFSGPVDAGYAEFLGEQDRSQPLKTLRHVRIERQVARLIQGEGSVKESNTRTLLAELAGRTSSARSLSLLLKRYYARPEEQDLEQRKKEFAKPLDTEWSKTRALSYVQVMEDFNRLAASRNAAFMTVLPPLLFDRKPISDTEKKCLALLGQNVSDLAVRSDRYRPYADILQQAIKTRAFMNDLSGIFTTETEPMYVDAGHFNAAGQRRIAAAIVGLMLTNPNIRQKAGL